MKIVPVAVAALLILSGCQKDLIVPENSINAETVSSDATGPGEFPTCKLRRIVHEHDGVPGFLVNGLFTYNSTGNPVSLTYSDNGPGIRNQYFYYDKQNRLREWREAYHPEDPVEAVWHKYGYNSNNQIVSDTTLVPGWEYEGQIIPDQIWKTSTITYDVQGRIIKETIKNLSAGTTSNPTYTYDNRGNIGVIGWRSSWYDTKVSFLRSHPVFQFLMRNYSRNNPWNLNSQDQKYNSKGLPLSIQQPNDAFFAAYKIEKLIYDCQ